jgi:hypothetical protein
MACSTTLPGHASRWNSAIARPGPGSVFGDLATIHALRALVAKAAPYEKAAPYKMIDGTYDDEVLMEQFL